VWPALADAMPDRRVRPASGTRCSAGDGAQLGHCLRHDDGNDSTAQARSAELKLAVGRCPRRPAPLASQSTISRRRMHEQDRGGAALGGLVDQYCASVRPSRRESRHRRHVLCAHGGQQLAFGMPKSRRARLRLDAHLRRGERRAGGRHPASGADAERHGGAHRHQARHASAIIKSHWPSTHIIWRGDSHYGRVEAMQWAEDNGSGYIFGLAGNAALDAWSRGRRHCALASRDGSEAKLAPG